MYKFNFYFELTFLKLNLYILINNLQEFTRMKFIFLRGAIILLVISVITLMPCLLLYYLGYTPNLDWNQSATITQCKVYDHIITNKTCSVSCNCASITSVITCDTCYFECYDGYISVTYAIYNNTIEVISNNEFYDNVVDYLNNNYPINESVVCYYQSDDPYDVRVNYKNYIVYLVFFIIFVSLGSLILLVWLSCEIIFKCCYHRDSKNENNNVEMKEI